MVDGMKDEIGMFVFFFKKCEGEGYFNSLDEVQTISSHLMASYGTV